MVVKVTKIVEWDMGHRVPSHQNKCQNPHGHRYRLEVTVSGEVDIAKGEATEGMVYDFDDLKRALVTKIHDVLDHNFMLYEGDQQLQKMFHNYKMSCICVPFIPTAENIAVWCYQQLKDEFPSKVAIVNLRVYETPNSWADFVPPKQA